MNRLQCMIILTVLLTTLPAACVTPTPTAEVDAVVITFACMDYQHDYYQDLAQEFQKLHPAITVELVSKDQVLGRSSSGGVAVASSDDIYKIAAAADAFVDFAGMLGDAPQEIVLDLTDLVEQDDKFTLDDFSLARARWPSSRAGASCGACLSPPTRDSFTTTPSCSMPPVCPTHRSVGLGTIS